MSVKPAQGAGTAGRRRHGKREPGWYNEAQTACGGEREQQAAGRGSRRRGGAVGGSVEAAGRGVGEVGGGGGARQKAYGEARGVAARQRAGSGEAAGGSGGAAGGSVGAAGGAQRGHKHHEYEWSRQAGQLRAQQAIGWAAGTKEPGRELRAPAPHPNDEREVHRMPAKPFQALGWQCTPGEQHVKPVQNDYKMRFLVGGPGRDPAAGGTATRLICRANDAAAWIPAGLGKNQQPVIEIKERGGDGGERKKDTPGTSSAITWDPLRVVTV
ncbi:hypothetical protein B0H11DRAFT_2333904 [Mycena galericulata]|nr:hypothetical protein B0H11DRAFT_2333904 [Mycena galericulata]